MIRIPGAAKQFRSGVPVHELDEVGEVHLHAVLGLVNIKGEILKGACVPELPHNCRHTAQTVHTSTSIQYSP